MQTDRQRFVVGPSIAVIALAAMLVGCGLGIDNAARLERGEEAYRAAEYRAAAIDAKKVLQDEPRNLRARLLLGRASLEAGDVLTATVELRRAKKLGAKFADTATDLGRALLIQGKYDEVISEIDPALIQSGEDRRLILRIRGDAYLGLGEPARAREAYEGVVDEDRHNLGALLGVVQSYIDEQNLILARETLDRVLDIDANNVPGWISSGTVSTLMQQHERAGADYANAVRLANSAENLPAEMVALYGLADTQLGMGLQENAQLTHSRMHRISAEDSRTLVVSARLAAADARWSDAQRDLHQVLLRDPENRLAHLLLGSVHKASGNIEQAEMYLSAVVKNQPDNSVARGLLAETRLALNKTNEAQDALAPLVKGDKANVATLSMSAAIYLQSANFGDATEILKSGIAANPGEPALQLQLAYVQFLAGDPDAAAQTLRNISTITVDQNEFQHDSLAILIELAGGNLPSGLEKARAIVSRWPDRAAAHNMLGFALAVSEQNEAARQSFEMARMLSPENTGPLWFLAQLDEANHDIDAAKRHYELILEQKPQDTRAMIAAAKIAQKQNDFGEARSWLQKAIAVDPADVTSRKALGSSLIASRDHSAAEQVLREVLEITTSDAQVYDLLGRTQLYRENYSEAETSFERALMLDATNPDYRLNLTKSQAAQGNYAAAISTIEDLGVDCLQHVPTGIMLATLQANTGKFDNAIEIAARLAELHPDVAAPRALQGELLSRTGDHLAASAAYDDALILENSRALAIRATQIRGLAKTSDATKPLVGYLRERPLDSVARSYLAQAYQAEGKLEEAGAQYLKIVEFSPNDFVALNNLAWIFLQTDDLRAEAMARRAFQIRPENGSVVDTLGWILASKGEYQDGIRYLRDAVKLENDRVEVRYHLAAALAASGSAGEARDILQDILSNQRSFASRREVQTLLSTL